MEGRQSKIIWTNGCFDILHYGHISLLEYDKSLGDKLIVGLDTDERVKESKGNDRPINKLKDRIFNIEKIGIVDLITYFNTDDELRKCIEFYNIDIIVVGSEYKGMVIGQDLSVVKYFDRIGNYSTTNEINKLR